MKNLLIFALVFLTASLFAQREFQTYEFKDFRKNETVKTEHFWKVWNDSMWVDDQFFVGSTTGNGFETNTGTRYLFSKSEVRVFKGDQEIYRHYIKLPGFWQRVRMPMFWFALLIGIWVVYRTNVKYNSRKNKRHPSVEIYRDKSRQKARWWMAKWFMDHGFDETYTVEDVETGQVDRIAPGGDSHIVLTLMEKKDE